MADLSRGRMSEEAPVSFCVVDMFGHFLVKNGHLELKRYGTLYTCFSSSATHIEVTYSLKNKLFIMCLRRFIGRRRNVRLIRSGNGSNFTGASAKLIQAFQEMNHSRISNYLEEHGGGMGQLETKPSIRK